MAEECNHIRKYLFPKTKENETIILLEQFPLKMCFINNNIINKEQFSSKLSIYNYMCQNSRLTWKICFKLCLEYPFSSESLV